MNPSSLRRQAMRWVMMGLLLACVSVDGLPRIRFSGVFISNKNDPNPTLLDGTYSSDMGLVSGTGLSDLKWRFSESVVFKNGRFGFFIPYPTDPLVRVPTGVERPQDGFQFDFDAVSLSVFPSVSGVLAETFRLYSYPFAVSTQLADYALSTTAEEMESVAELSTNQVSVNHTMSVLTSGFLVNSKNVAMGGAGAPSHRLSVVGVLNATGYYVNGIPLSDTLPWQAPIGAPYIRSSPAYHRIGIGVKYPLSTLHVGGSGTVNTTQAFLTQGQPFTYANQWRSPVSGSEADNTATVYVPEDLLGVGIGIYRPMERLELDGALRMSLDLLRTHQAGSIQYGVLPSPLMSSRTRRDFQGLVASGNQLIWTTLLGYDREPRPNRLSYFKPTAESDTALPIMGATGVEWSSTLQGLGIGMTPDAAFSLRPLATQLKVPLWSIINSQSGVPYYVFSIDSTGNVGIGTSSPQYTLDVDGIINVQDVYENEAPYRLSRSKGTYFQRNANSDIFYLHGNVGIGRPDPISRLDIAAINVERDTKQENPALSISMRSGGSVTRYTMGVDLGSQETFRVEQGDTLGSRTPLFVAQRDRFGVGTDTPYANLTVSGNGGIVLGGGFPNGEVIDPFTESSYFLWYPRKNVFRAMGSAVEQTDANMGLHSTAMGWESMAKGNFSLVMGGQNNRVEGAYASTVGGSNLVITDTSDFSLGLGTNVQIQHHGVWAWGDRNGAPLASQRDNQWVIRAGGGVGIGTNQTSVADAYGMNERPISLAVGGGLVTPYLFLPGGLGDLQDGVTAFVVDPTQNAQALVNDMVASGRLSASGALLSFNRQAPYLYDTGPYSTNAEIKTILNRLVDRPILRLVGQSQDRLVVYQTGTVVLGSAFGDVPGLMMDGMVGVATTSPQADLHMVLPLSSGGVSLNRGVIWVATTNSIPTQPIMVVDEYGNVGFRQLPDFRPYGSTLTDPNPEKKGAYLFAASLQVSSMSWWNGMTLTSGAFAGDPWMKRPAVGNLQPLVFPSANPVVRSGIGVIPRTGNVGIGTPSPNALLTLSNRASARNALLLQPVRWPTLTFDWDGTDIMSVGRRAFAPNTLLVYAGGSGVDDVALGHSGLMISPTQVGIKTSPNAGVVLDVDGVMVLNPSANASVSALRIGQGPLVVPSPLPLLPLLLGVSRVDASNFSVGGVLQDWADGQNGSVVRFTDLGEGLYSYTGIGRTDPAFDLDVKGTVRMDALMATSATFSVVTASTPVGFLEAGENAALLSVASDRLVVQYGSNQVDLSAVMTKGTSLQGGALGMFALDTPLGLPPFARTEMWWQPDRDDVLNAPGQWSVTGSMSLVKPHATRSLSTQWVSSVNINAGFSHQASLTRGPFLSDSFGYALTHTGVTLSNVVDLGVVGWRAVVTFNPTAVLSSGVVGVGLNVDLSQAVAQTVGVRGEKIAAIFMPIPGQPGVGIGTSYPNATLDVRGAMVADRFIIGSELSLVTMNVGYSYLNLTQSQGVGIDTSSPLADLDIRGGAHIVGLMRVKRGVVAPNLLMATAPFIAANDRVGMGITAPVSALHTQHLINAITPLSRTGFSYGVHVGAGNVFATGGLTGLNVSLRSVADRFGYTTQPVNWLGLSLLSTEKVTPVAYGVRLNATGLSLASTPLVTPPPSPKITGLWVAVPTSEGGNDRFVSATFLNTIGGSKVGIGLSNPSQALEVAGDIKVDFFDLSMVSTREFGTLASQKLVVLNQTKVLGPVVVADAMVNRMVTADQLTVVSPLDISSQVLGPHTAVLSSLRVSDPIVTIASINAWLGTLQVVVATVNRLVSWADDTPLDGVSLKLGDGVLSSLRTMAGITASSLSIPNRLVVANQKVGIGGEAGAFLQVRQVGTASYAPSTVGTWAAIHLQHAQSTAPLNPVGAGVWVRDNSGQGAGVLGYRTSSLVPSDRTDHALLFLTQMADAVPKESMRVLASGQVRMGFRSDTVMDVALDPHELAVSGSVTVSLLRGLEKTMIRVPFLSLDGVITTVSATTLFADTYLSQPLSTLWLSMASQNTTIDTLGLSHLGVAAPGGVWPPGAFVFTNAANRQANLGNDVFSGDPNSVLVYHPQTGQLSNVSLTTMGVGPTQWRVTVNMTQANAVATSGIQMGSTLGVSGGVSGGAGVSVRASVAPRAVSATGVTLSAVSMVATGNGKGNAAMYRALVVDVSQVPTRSYNGLNVQYGVAHAALFQSGSDAKNTWLLADRWSLVGQDQPAMIRIKADAALTDPVLSTEAAASNRGHVWVSKDMSVSMTNLGTRSTMEGLFPNALMGVLGDNELLRIRDDGGGALVLTVVGSTPRLLLGVTQSSSDALQVNGVLRASESGGFDSVQMASLQHANAQGVSILTPQSALDTRLGIGVSNPTYALEVGKQVTGSTIGTLSDDQVLQKVKMGLAFDTYPGTVLVKGLDIAMGVTSNISIDNQLTFADGATALLMGIDATKAVLTGQARLIGLSVSINQGSGKGGYFTGGRVGIGTLTPRSSLEVAGTISGASLYQSALGNWQLDRATVNRLGVISTLNVSSLGTLTHKVGRVSTNVLRIMASNFELPNADAGEEFKVETVTAGTSSINQLLVSDTHQIELPDVSRLGRSFPSVSLKGGLWVDGTLTAGWVTLNRLNHPEALVVQAPMVTVNQGIQTAHLMLGSMRFSNVKPDTLETPDDVVPMVVSGNHLYVYNSAGGGAWINLSDPKLTNGVSNKWAYYDADAQLGSLASLTMSGSKLEVAGRLAASRTVLPNQSGTVMAQRWVHPLRTIDANQYELVGSKVIIQNMDVADGDWVAGLRVSVDSSVSDTTYFPDGRVAIGQKIGALFLGGVSWNVLIDPTTGVIRPLSSAAALWVRNTPNNGWLRVMGEGTALQVTDNRIRANGLSTAVSARWAGRGVTGTPLMAVMGSNGVIMLVSDNKLAIATTNLSHTLTAPVIKGTEANILTMTVNAVLQVAKNDAAPVLWFPSKIGIGGTAPAAVWALQTNWQAPSDMAVPSTSLMIAGALTGSNTMTGIKVGIQATGNLSWASSAVIKGVALDMRTLGGNTNSHGLWVRVPANRVAFQTRGRVGIGTTDPSDPFAVTGQVSMNAMTVLGVVSANTVAMRTAEIPRVTLNQLQVTTVSGLVTLTVNQSIRYNTLTHRSMALPSAKDLSANDMKATSLYVYPSLVDGSLRPGMAGRALWAIGDTRWQSLTVQTTAAKPLKASNWNLRSLKAGELVFMNRVSMNTVQQSVLKLKPRSGSPESGALASNANLTSLSFNSTDFLSHIKSNPNQVAVYGTGGVLGVLNLPVDPSEGMIRATVNKLTAILSVGPTAAGPLSSMGITMGLTDRPGPAYEDTPQQATFNGMVIDMTFNNGASSAVDVVQGVMVDVSQLNIDNSVPLPVLSDTPIQATKQAAVFMAASPGEQLGGTVGVMAIPSTDTSYVASVNATLTIHAVGSLQHHDGASLITLQSFPMMTVSNASGMPLMQVSANSWVINTTETTYRMGVSGDVRMGTATQGTRWAVVGDAMRWGVGWGDAVPSASVHLSREEVPFKLGSQILTVESGGMGINGLPGDAALFVSGNVVLKQATGATPRYWLVDSQKIGVGLSSDTTSPVADVTVHGYNKMAIGTRNASPAAAANALTVIGDTCQMALAVGSVATNCDVVQGPYPLQWGTTNPTGVGMGTANMTNTVLTLSTPNGRLLLATANGAPVLAVNANGRVGIFTTDPTAVLSVVGNVTATGVKADAVVSANTLVGKELNVSDTTVTQSKTLSDISGWLSTDFNTNNFIGMWLTVKVPDLTQANESKLRGLWVTVNLETKDVSLANGPRKGTQLAAAFMGGPVVINGFYPVSGQTPKELITKFDDSERDTSGVYPSADGKALLMVGGINNAGIRLSTTNLGMGWARLYPVTTSRQPVYRLPDRLFQSKKDVTYAQSKTSMADDSVAGSGKVFNQDSDGKYALTGTVGELTNIANGVTMTQPQFNDLVTALQSTNGIRVTPFYASDVNALLLGMGVAPTGNQDRAVRYPPGRVSVGTNQLGVDTALLVSGDMRVGVRNNRSVFGAAQAGNGNQLIFSGGEGLIEGGDSTNTDTFTMGRYNRSAGVSELRVQVQDSDTTSPNAMVVLGPINNEPLSSGFQGMVVQHTGYADPNDVASATKTGVDPTYTAVGQVGMGTTQPRAVFEVKHSGTGAESPEMTDHIVGLVGTTQNIEQEGLLALRAYPGANSTFINMISSVNMVGGIQVPSVAARFRYNVLNAGVTFEGMSADYAEYVPRGMVASPQPGEVVSVDQGRTRYHTDGQGVLMVMSDRPIVVGNWQEGHVSADMVSFMGQVDVKVVGSVAPGDYLVPSGAHDGRAKAMPWDQVVADQVIGVAITTANGETRTVRALVGVPFKNQVLARQLVGLATIRAEATALQQQTVEQRARLVEQLDAWQARLDGGVGTP